MIKPLSNRVVIKPCQAETITPGGIILPDNAKEVPNIGEVVAVGPGKMTEAGVVIPMQVSVGDKVVYSKYSGSDVEIDDVGYKVIEEANILAII